MVFPSTRLGVVAPYTAIPPAYAASVLALNPLGYWRLGEPSGTNANDESTTNNDGTYGGTPTLGVAGGLIGDSNTAVTFLGSSSQYVSIPQNAAYNVGTGNYSIGFLFKTTSRSVMYLVDYDSESTNGFYAAWDGDHLAAQVQGTGAGVVSGGGNGLLADGAWHRAIIAMTRASTGQWYVDGAASGAAVDISASSGANVQGFNPFFIARRLGGLYLTGSMDEVAFYGTAITSAQALSLDHAAGY